MARMGFIQDKLEIKFLLLYIASRLIEPVPFEAMQELAMIDDGVDFFDFSECMNDLVTSGHLTLSEDGLYAITEKGLRNGQICESSLPYSVRLAADKNITVFNQKLRRRAQIRSEITPRPNGTYTVPVDSTNLDLANAPEWSGSISADWRTPIGPGELAYQRIDERSPIELRNEH